MAQNKIILGTATDIRQVKSADKNCPKTMLKTKEASDYLRKSVSWLLRRKDIGYVPGAPNLYDIADLNDWLENNKHTPMV
ncbi:MAG: helix-turn-helix domain-containing protein [Proteobacteria bacterium]|nr:helix-turn-helix domain-containing protein [Pseudomonadota bacterium]MBU1739879.1 helix-turn-helix domain-containing protein [Pseudomonadota bacterium]MBU1858209.1 helix-turn-helix domain-containing protein [Verrucomicrobiota bacterium]